MFYSKSKWLIRTLVMWLNGYMLLRIEKYEVNEIDEILITFIFLVLEEILGAPSSATRGI